MEKLTKKEIDSKVNYFSYLLVHHLDDWLLGLGYKSSRILGLEEAFIPELRKIEPIPGMSEENREKLHRRRLAMEEERMSRLRDHNRDEVRQNMV